MLDESVSITEFGNVIVSGEKNQQCSVIAPPATVYVLGAWGVYQSDSYACRICEIPSQSRLAQMAVLK